jgi:hypothetical protein
MVPETKHSTAPYDERKYLRPSSPGSTLLVLDCRAAIDAIEQLSPEERIAVLWPGEPDDE